MRIDLQSHSLHSDGELTPTDVVARAGQAGVELLALTDHDTVDGVDEALAAASEQHLTLISATEISAVDAGYEDLHVLGFAIDQHGEELLGRLADARADRERRAERMAETLVELGYAVDDAPLAARRAAGKSIGRPHLARAVLTHPDNATRLRQEGHQDVTSLIRAYLIPGAPAYAGRTRPTVTEAIGWIHDAGGLAVWAHPFWDIPEDAAVLDAIDRYREAGLDGVECFYVTHDERQTRLLADRCAALGLLTTASSDFHGPDHRLFSRFLAYGLHDREPQLGALLARAA
ncbi:MAG: PHP domain-containing protein [Solirubrobacteraceae bacterium]|jgi:predicted metal-dependent phosphoesterase TrpH